MCPQSNSEIPCRCKSRRQRPQYNSDNDFREPPAMTWISAVVELLPSALGVRFPVHLEKEENMED